MQYTLAKAVELFFALLVILGVALGALLFLLFSREKSPPPQPQSIPGNLYIKVSDLTACSLKVFYNLLFKRHTGQALKPRRSPERVKAMNHGSRIHRDLQAQWILERAEAFVRWDAPPLLGRIDGLKGSVLYEIKSVANLDSVEGPKEWHLVQVNTYLGMLSLSEAQLIYVERSSGREKRFKLRFDEVLFEMTLRRARGIWENFLQGWPPDPEPREWECEECPYRALCPVFAGSWKGAFDNAEAEGLGFVAEVAKRRV